MQINELIGKSAVLPVYNQAQTLFRKPNIHPGARANQLRLFTDFIKTYGFENLGTGQFGAVYERKNYPWVFKIFSDDPAYKRYIKYVITHQSNPHVPQIRGNIIKINAHTYAVRMEKLKNVSLTANITRLLDMLCTADKFSDIHPDDLNWLKRTYPDMVELIKAITKTDYLDIYGGNIMMRGNVPVLTDPVVSNN